MAAALFLSALFTIAAASPQPTASAASATAAPAVFMGISLGATTRAVRAQLGKPREVLSASIGDVWRYDVDHGNATFDVVIATDAVVDIAARTKPGKQSSLADPFGGALGMTTTTLATARGAPAATLDNGARLAYTDAAGGRWFYEVNGGVITGIELSTPLPPPPAAQVVSDTRHDGSTIDRALVVNAATEADGVQAEMDYLGSLSCDGDGRWQVVNQELVPAAGRYYDLIHTVCSVSKHPRDFYFDATSFYSK